MVIIKHFVIIIMDLLREDFLVKSRGFKNLVLKLYLVSKSQASTLLLIYMQIQNQHKRISYCNGYSLQNAQHFPLTHTLYYCYKKLQYSIQSN